MKRWKRGLLRLFVTDHSPSSQEAKECLQCAEVKENYDTEVIDVLEDPQRAADDDIFVTPTTIRVSPQPEARVDGVTDCETLIDRLEPI